MSNLFVVRTPLQLLTAYIITANYFQDDDNVLIYIHRNHEKLYQECFYVRKIFNDTLTWQVLRYEKWLEGEKRLSGFKKKIQQMKETLLQYYPKFDKVFLGEDKTFENQLLVELSGNDHYYRMEDGVWSYHAPDRCWSSKLWHGAKMRVLRFLVGLHSDMIYNAGGIGCGKAAIADYLYKPHLIERYSPRIITIERDKVMNAMGELIGEEQQYQNELPNQVVLFLGSKLVEQGKIVANDEIEILRQIYDLCNQNGLTLCYKPHPAEKTSKLEIYKKELPKLEFCLIREPMEILYYCLNDLKCVLAHSSSGLIFANVFSKNIVSTVALFKLYGRGQSDSCLNRLMEKAGVVIPNNPVELEECLLALS